MACDKAIEDARYYSKIEGIKEGKIEDVKNLMNSLHINVEKALELLGIPKIEWDKYIDSINVADACKIAWISVIEG